MTPSMQAKVDEAAEACAVRAGKLLHDQSDGPRTTQLEVLAEIFARAAFKGGAEFLYSLMQSEIVEAEKRGYMKAVEKLRAYKGGSAGPIMASWLESELGGEK